LHVLLFFKKLEEQAVLIAVLTPTPRPAPFIPVKTCFSEIPGKTTLTFASWQPFRAWMG
jgi:hypothetical protein